MVSFSDLFTYTLVLIAIITLCRSDKTQKIYQSRVNRLAKYKVNVTYLSTRLFPTSVLTASGSRVTLSHDFDGS